MLVTPMLTVGEANPALVPEPQGCKQELQLERVLVPPETFKLLSQTHRALNFVYIHLLLSGYEIREYQGNGVGTDDIHCC
jgi:hypothetical protein